MCIRDRDREPGAWLAPKGMRWSLSWPATSVAGSCLGTAHLPQPEPSTLPPLVPTPLRLLSSGPIPHLELLPPLALIGLPTSSLLLTHLWRQKTGGSGREVQDIRARSKKPGEQKEEGKPEMSVERTVGGQGGDSEERGPLNGPLKGLG
eukprot:1037470-Rhodomonas_salina.2